MTDHKDKMKVVRDNNSFSQVNTYLYCSQTKKASREKPEGDVLVLLHFQSEDDMNDTRMTYVHMLPNDIAFYLFLEILLVEFTHFRS